MKKSRKVFLGVIIALFIVLSLTPSVKALTAEELQTMIAQLQAQIAELQRQLAILQSSQETWCYTFNVNLRIGDSGPEIDELAYALSKEGLFSAARTVSEFDESLASAVVGFQEKYASEILAPWGLTHGTGYVGSTTRAKLNTLYGCQVTTSCTDSDGGINYYGKGKACEGSKCYEDVCQDSVNLLEYDCGWEFGIKSSSHNRLGGATYQCPNGCENGACKETSASSITLLSPNGGELWAQNSDQSVNWTSSNIPLSNSVKIVARYYRDGYPSDNYTDYVLKEETQNDGAEKVYTTGFPAGQYAVLVKTMVNNSVLYDWSDNYFKIYVPVITTTSGLTVSKDATSPTDWTTVASTTSGLNGDEKTLAVFRLSAGSSEGLDLDQIAITATGGSYVNTYYFYNDTNLLGSQAGGNSVTMIFTDNTLTIPANGYKLITVKADISGFANNSKLKVFLEGNNNVKTTGLSSGNTIVSNTNISGGLLNLFDLKNWCQGNDVNRDGKVNSSDVTITRNNFTSITGLNCSVSNDWCSWTDVNKNGVVDSLDVDTVRNSFSGFLFPCSAD